MLKLPRIFPYEEDEEENKARPAPAPPTAASEQQTLPGTGQTNQGRDTCYKCGSKTVKVDTGMFSLYDICPKCKV